MKLPRDLSGPALAKAPERLGYRVVRQTGGHMRLTPAERGECHLTIPRHDPLRVGTLSAILGDVAEDFETTRQQLAMRLFED